MIQVHLARRLAAQEFCFQVQKILLAVLQVFQGLQGHQSLEVHRMIQIHLFPCRRDCRRCRGQSCHSQDHLLDACRQVHLKSLQKGLPQDLSRDLLCDGDQGRCSGHPQSLHRRVRQRPH